MGQTVNESVYSKSVFDGLNNFYHTYVVDTLDDTFQIFKSFTYGEMTIALLLLTIVLILSLKWLWEVLR